MPMTTIKVSTELRDRLTEKARREGGTLAAAIERSLDAADAAEFWARIRATMGGDEERAQLVREAEQFAGSAADGLDPDEDWTDIL